MGSSPVTTVAMGWKTAASCRSRLCATRAAEEDVAMPLLLFWCVCVVCGGWMGRRESAGREGARIVDGDAHAALVD